MRNPKPIIITIAVVFSLASALCAGPAMAAESKTLPVSYSLDELVRMALENADPVGIAEQNVQIAEKTKEMALSVLMPTMSAVGNAKRYKEETQFKGSTVQPTWDASWGVQAGQRVTVNGRELTALQIAEKGIDKSRLDLAAVKENLVIRVAEAFYAVAKASKAVEIANANVLRLQAHRKAVESKLKLAEVAKTEAFRTDAELAKAKSTQIQATNGYRLALASLARLADISSPFEIIEETVIGLPTFPDDLEVLKAIAENRRVDIKSSDIQQQIAADRVKYARGAFWPTLGWEGAWINLSQDPDPVLDETSYVGLTLKYDFFDGGLRKAQVGEAVAQKYQAQLAKRDLEKTVGLEVESAWLDWQTQNGTIHSLEAQLLYAQENYKAVSLLFAHGMANSVDVMDANTLLVTAERELTEASFNLRLAVLKVEKATGVLLERVMDEKK